MLSRRVFLFTLLVAPSIKIKDALFENDRRKIILAKLRKQMDDALDSRWYGIPYHKSNYSTGEWLGFKRV